MERLFTRQVARELTAEELALVSGGFGNSFYCLPEPIGGSGSDTVVYGPD